MAPNDHATAASPNASALQPSATDISGTTPKAKICVYCGSSAGTKPAHIEAARALARAMADNDMDLGAWLIGLSWHLLVADR